MTGHPAVPTPISAVAEILAFAATRPVWQQVLIRRLVAIGEIDTDTFELALGSLLHEHGAGAAVVGEPTAPPDLPAEIHHAGAVRVRVVSVGPVVNVNRLAEGQRLPLLPNGLTVVYGHNASGKTGYVRALRALASPSEFGSHLLGDVLVQGMAESHVEVSYTVDNEPARSIDWTVGEPGPPSFRALVLDSQSSRVYADEERRLEILPPGLEVLPRLGSTMAGMAARVDELIVAARGDLPDICLGVDQATPVGVLLGRLDGSDVPPEAEEIRNLATPLSPEEETEQQAIQRNQSVDATTMAGRLERFSRTLATLAERIASAQEAFGPEASESLAASRREVAEARQAAELAANEMTGAHSILPQIGSEAWRFMFAYAREYATAISGTDQFPPDGPDARCPLCQQRLSAEASDRQRHFNSYIDAVAERRARAAEDALASAMQKVRSTAITPSADLDSIATAAEHLAPQALALVGQARDVLEAAQESQTALLTPIVPVAEAMGRLNVEATTNLARALADESEQLAAQARGLLNPADATRRETESQRLRES